MALGMAFLCARHVLEVWTEPLGLNPQRLSWQGVGTLLVPRAPRVGSPKYEAAYLIPEVHPYLAPWGQWHLDHHILNFSKCTCHLRHDTPGEVRGSPRGRPNNDPSPKMSTS